MTEQERFHFGYVCGDTGLIDEQAELKWFIENCCSINDLKKNWKTVCDKLNELNDENEQLKQVIQEAYTILKEADLFSDKATTHDTIAYKEMFKFDNKDSYSIAKGIKEAMKILKESG